MQIASIHTRISRDKLKHYISKPDTSTCLANSQVKETSETYYQPAIELLSAIQINQKDAI